MENKIYQVIADILEVDVANITKEMCMENVEEWDSIAHIRIIAELEEVLGMQIPFEKVLEIKRVGDFFEFI